MTQRIVYTSRIVAVLLLLVSYSPRCFAQAGNPANGAPKRAEAPTPTVAGCYELNLGRWWPWGFGEDNKFVTPPKRVQLLPERGTQGWEEGEFLIRRFPLANQTTPGRGGPSYWRVKTGNQIDLIWNEGFTGVTLTMEIVGDNLRGWAHPHFDSAQFVPRIARVTARRIPCTAAR
jgi:hypothetical protein